MNSKTLTILLSLIPEYVLMSSNPETLFSVLGISRELFKTLTQKPQSNQTEINNYIFLSLFKTYQHAILEIWGQKSDLQSQLFYMGTQ